MNAMTSCVKVGLIIAAMCIVGCQSEPVDLDPPLVRIHNFTVTPSTGPVANVTIRNPNEHPLSGVMTVAVPEGWAIDPASMEIEIAPDLTETYSYVIEKAVDAKSNRYTVGVRVEGPGFVLNETQEVACATTPYFKPAIDGDLAEWEDSVPITFETGGKSTTVMSYWNRTQYCLAVKVQEDELTEHDAVQFALSPRGSVTGSDSSDTAQRNEFLVKDGSCFTLIQPGEALSLTTAERDLQPIEAEVAVKRSGDTTCYEIALPVASIAPIEPKPGREYCFSLLLHDPDGVGIRDLGTVMNLWDESRGNPHAWCNWTGANYTDATLFDNKIEFGFSSSIH